MRRRTAGSDRGRATVGTPAYCAYSPAAPVAGRGGCGGRCWQSHQLPPRQSVCRRSRHAPQIIAFPSSWTPSSVKNGPPVREWGTMSRQIFQLRISLADVTPEVWRRVAVPGAYTLDRLHRVLQYAMGWQNYHLHSFEIDGVQYGEPDPEGELELRDELEVRLDAVAGKDRRFLYTYDFGDWWEHEVSL